ncbi:hypothetical protein MRX96_037558 [Rhipicephalus microplus]
MERFGQSNDSVAQLLSVSLQYSGQTVRTGRVISFRNQGRHHVSPLWSLQRHVASTASAQDRPGFCACGEDSLTPRRPYIPSQELRHIRAVRAAERQRCSTAFCITAG